jgi:hypothetical protein
LIDVGARLLFVIVALGSASGEPKPRDPAGLSSKECVRVCDRIVNCAPRPLGTLPSMKELIDCQVDCAAQSKDGERRAGWQCAARAVARGEDCAALKKCDVGAKTEKPKAATPRAVPGV